MVTAMFLFMKRCILFLYHLGSVKVKALSPLSPVTPHGNYKRGFHREQAAAAVVDPSKEVCPAGMVVDTENT